MNDLEELQVLAHRQNKMITETFKAYRQGDQRNLDRMKRHTFSNLHRLVEIVMGETK